MIPSVERLYYSCKKRRAYYASKNMEAEVAIMDKAILAIEQEFDIAPSRPDRTRYRVSMALQAASTILAMFAAGFWNVPLALVAWGMMNLAWSMK